MAATPPPRFAHNPFFVLGAEPDRPRVELEREGQKLLGMLELGLRSAATYATPTGPEARTPEAVRAALAELRAPEKRLLHELWASFARAEADADADASASAGADPFRSPAQPSAPKSDDDEGPGIAGAFALFGWRRP